MTIPALINKQDNFEIIRDQIAQILANESVSQQALAVLATEDPDDWKLRVFIERSNPWSQFENDPSDVSPLVNVWYDISDFDKRASNVMERQKSTSIFNVDCYGFGKATDEPLGGHKPGDREAAFEVQRCVRLVRNILMSSIYTYLDLRGTVWSRSFRSIKLFQPQIDKRSVQQIVGARCEFEVSFNEFSPQGDESNNLELVSVDVLRAENGEIVVEADYEYPL